MARKNASTDGHAFPSVAYERVPDPVGQRAIDQPGVLRTLLQREVRALRWAGIGAVLVAASITTMVVWPDAPVIAVDVFVLLAGAYAVVHNAFRTIGVIRIWATMRRHPWRVFKCQLPQARVEGPLVMTLTRRDKSYQVRTAGGERTLAIWRNPRPEVWFVGDPGKRGVLTPAGGPELFITHPVRPARAAARAAAARKKRRAKAARTGPSLFRRLFPKRPPSAAALQRQAARAARQKAADQVRRQKMADRAKARAAKAAARRAANPPAPRTPKAAQPKQPGLGTRLRQGRRVNWMK